jgi:hypothetical protein
MRPPEEGEGLPEGRCCAGRRREAWLQRKTEPRLEQRVHAEGGKERLARMGARVLGQPEWGGRISVPPTNLWSVVGALLELDFLFESLYLTIGLK